MKSFWKISAPIACVVTICGVAIVWHVYGQKRTERKLAEEARACRVRAEQGDAKAEYDLARMYHHGIGVPLDDTETLRWLRKAADQGYAKADYGIGYSYYYGQGVPQDYAEALRWYRKAADQGDVKAQNAIGSMYYYGKGVPQDYVEAAGWYRKAADLGEANAQDAIASMYYYGRGVSQDNGEAARWYRQAANQGLAKAEYDLGFMYNNGYGVPRDRAEANRWFHKAADQGDEYARRTLGLTWVGLTKIHFVLLSIQFLGGVFFSIQFLRRGKSLRNSRVRVETLAGILCLFTVGLGWYGYTHHLIKPLCFGFSAFSLFKWLLSGVVVALLIYILLAKKTPGQQPEGITGSPPSGSGRGVLGL